MYVYENDNIYIYIYVLHVVLSSACDNILFEEWTSYLHV